MVTSLRSESALSTTAIALAIITFIVQLIVYVAQAEQSRRENELNLKLHSEVASNLNELMTHAQGTQSIVETMNEKVLDKALQMSGSEKLENVPPEFSRDLAQNISSLMQTNQSEGAASVAAAPVETQFPVKTWGRDEDERVARELSTWPEGERAAKLRSLVEDLSDEAAFMLRQFAFDELENRDPDSPLAPSWRAQRGGLSDQLFERGIIESFPGAAYGERLAHLTEAGRQAARVFTAEGDPPGELSDAVQQVRAAAARYSESTGRPGRPNPRRS